MLINKDLIDIDEKESKLENSIHYDILSHYKNRDVPGTADIFFKKVDHYRPTKPVMANSVYKDCISNGFIEDDIIGHLRFFYPNGGDFKRDYMRNGVGGFVLKKIISDVLSHHGKMIYVFSTTEYMDNFLSKNHFYHSSEFDSQFYLDLKKIRDPFH